MLKYWQLTARACISGLSLSKNYVMCTYVGRVVEWFVLGSSGFGSLP
jgi:hypothetical protein